VCDGLIVLVSGVEGENPSAVLVGNDADVDHRTRLQRPNGLEMSRPASS
jgi:hypothetical protein